MAVPEIMPLETLHNSLTLAHFDKFLTNVIDMGTLSPKRSYSAMPVSLVGSLGMFSHSFIRFTWNHTQTRHHIFLGFVLD